MWSKAEENPTTVAGVTSLHWLAYDFAPPLKGSNSWRNRALWVGWNICPFGPLKWRLKKDVLLANSLHKANWHTTTTTPVIKSGVSRAPALFHATSKRFDGGKRTHERNIFLSSEKNLLQASGWRSIKRLFVWNLHQKSKGASEKKNPWDLSNIHYHAQQRCQFSTQIHQHPMEFHGYIQKCIASRRVGETFLHACYHKSCDKYIIYT